MLNQLNHSNMLKIHFLWIHFNKTSIPYYVFQEVCLHQSPLLISLSSMRVVYPSVILFHLIPLMIFVEDLQSWRTSLYFLCSVTYSLVVPNIFSERCFQTTISECSNGQENSLRRWDYYVLYTARTQLQQQLCKFIQKFANTQRVSSSRRQRVRIAAIQDNSLFATFRTRFYDVVPSRCARLIHVPSPTLIMFGRETCFYLSGYVLKAGMWCAICATGFTGPAFFSESINC